MTSAIIKTSVKIGIAAALAIILFQVSNLFLVYKYFRFDYYITAIAIIFLIAGMFVSKMKLKVNKIEPKQNAPDNLTQREIIILQQIIEGKSNKEIAALNYVEVSTIKTHINHIYAKLNIKNRKEAINRFSSAVFKDDEIMVKHR